MIVALAKKCDRCKVLFEYYPSESKRKYNAVIRALINKQGYVVEEEKFNDLCPECMKKFNEFMSNVKCGESNE